MEKIFMSLLRTQGAHAELARGGFQSLNLSEGQPKILYILLKSEGCVQKNLAEIAQVRPSTMAVLLDRMEKQGLIYRETTKISGGKRAYKIFLTENGKCFANKVEELVEELEVKSFKGFTEDEKETLFHLLARVESNLSQR